MRWPPIAAGLAIREHCAGKLQGLARVGIEHGSLHRHIGRIGICPQAAEIGFAVVQTGCGPGRRRGRVGRLSGRALRKQCRGCRGLLPPPHRGRARKPSSSYSPCRLELV